MSRAWNRAGVVFTPDWAAYMSAATFDDDEGDTFRELEFVNVLAPW